MPPRIQTLLLLDQYDQQQSSAQTHQKKSNWSLSKARRQKNRESISVVNTISALDVRDELRARAVVQGSVVPDLVGEKNKVKAGSAAGGGTGGTKESTERQPGLKSSGSWELVDLTENTSDAATNKESTKTTTTTGGGTDKKDGGKSEKVDGDKKDTGTKDKDPFAAEEERLRKADPLYLFGAFPTRDLRVAQKEAREALQSYIAAANTATTILDHIKKQEKQ